jgi:hypothetical protein
MTAFEQADDDARDELVGLGIVLGRLLTHGERRSDQDKGQERGGDPRAAKDESWHRSASVKEGNL